MTTVSGVTSTTTTTDTSSSTTSSVGDLDYNAFLKLLIAQLKNQDPTNPTDSTQYLSQLASFSSVEQSIQTNQKLDELLSTSRISQATGLIGKEIETTDGAVSGAVASVALADGQIWATLEDGTTLSIGDGVRIRDRAAAT